MKFINITNETLHFNGLPAWEAGEPMEVSHEGLIYAFENNSRQVKPLWLWKEEQKKKEVIPQGDDNAKTYLDTADSKTFSKKKKVKTK